MTLVSLDAQVVIVLRALVDCSEKEIFDKASRVPVSSLLSRSYADSLCTQITAGAESASFAAERVEIMLQEASRLGLRTRAQCLAHLGKHFRPVRSHTTSAYSAHYL